LWCGLCQGNPTADDLNLLPGVHMIAFLTKRWLLGAHQGAVDDAHLPACLNECSTVAARAAADCCFAACPNPP
jgi:hypothetical protein